MADIIVGKDYIPGHHQIETLTLTSTDGSRDVSLVSLFSVLNITEDIYTSSVSGNIELLDQVGVLEKIKLIGAEKLSIKFRSQDDDFYTLDFLVYDHTEIPSSASDGVVYNLFFITPEFYSSAISTFEGYHEDILSSIAEKVWGELGSGRELKVHESTGTQEIIIPGMTPFECMDFLANRSFDPFYKSSLWTFFETQEKYFFVNLERYMEEKILELGNNTQFLAEKTFTYNPSVNLIGQKERQKFLIQEFTFNNVSDSLERIQSGMNLHTVEDIDIFRKKITATDFNGIDEFKSFIHLDLATAVPLDKPEFIGKYLQNINTTRMIFSDTSRKPTFLEDLIGPRNFMMNALSQITSTAKIYGNTNIHAGDVIYLNFPGFNVNRDDTSHATLSGVWLVRTLTHTISGDNFATNMLLSKESYRREHGAKG